MNREPSIHECTPPMPETHFPAGRETILLVEDENFVRDVAREILESAGYLVLPASNAGEARRALQQHPGEVHLLLSDVVLPGENGRELARELRAAHPEMKTIFISGYADNIVVRQGLEESGVFYLPKPFSLESLACAVRLVLDGKLPGRRLATATAAAGKR